MCKGVCVCKLNHFAVHLKLSVREKNLKKNVCVCVCVCVCLRECVCKLNHSAVPLKLSVREKNLKNVCVFVCV